MFVFVAGLACLLEAKTVCCSGSVDRGSSVLIACSSAVCVCSVLESLMLSYRDTFTPYPRWLPPPSLRASVCLYVFIVFPSRHPFYITLPATPHHIPPISVCMYLSYVRLLSQYPRAPRMYMYHSLLALLLLYRPRVEWDVLVQRVGSEVAFLVCFVVFCI